MGTLTLSHRQSPTAFGFGVFFFGIGPVPLTRAPNAGMQISCWAKRVMDVLTPVLQWLHAALTQADDLTLLGKG